MTGPVARLSFAVLVLAAGTSALRAADVSLLGDWVIVEAMPAPWADESRLAALAAQGKRLINVEIGFKPSEVVSKHRPFACKRARYEPTDYPADAIFQGNLPEPNPSGAATRLGFPKGEISGVDLRCTGEVFSYHFRDRNTALTAFDNVIYTLKRK